jgi:hypothetical protein
VPKKQLSAADTVRSYKGLCEVERAFRSLKSVDLKIRPNHHRLEDRVRAHIFACSHTTWNGTCVKPGASCCLRMRIGRRTRDPPAAATRSQEALHKITERTLENGSPVHSFRTLSPDMVFVSAPRSWGYPAETRASRTPAASSNERRRAAWSKM